jgi:hypothetical protein
MLQDRPLANEKYQCPFQRQQMPIIFPQGSFVLAHRILPMGKEYNPLGPLRLGGEYECLSGIEAGSLPESTGTIDLDTEEFLYTKL